MAQKIVMHTPLAELDGDEMTRVIWRMIKDILLHPYLELKTEYYDLGLENRNKTEDQVTHAAALAIKKYGVGVKCATITANKERAEEYSLKKLWPSPNATIRSILGGTVFRTPITLDCLAPLIPSWKNPITIARHAYGDIYKSVEYKIREKGRAELMFTGESGTVTRKTVHDFSGPGMIMGIHNLDNSIEDFAKTCFDYALEQKQDLWFAAKDTISQTYDAGFKEIFQTVYQKHYAEKFAAARIEYFYTLIDDAVARIMRSAGGMVWACKNYDGDVLSDMVASVFGSLAMMNSVLLSPAGIYEYEAAHGTVQRHYYKHLKGETTSTNPMATLFAWSGALKKRGELDGNSRLAAFAAALEKAGTDTIRNGIITGDLQSIITLKEKKVVSTEIFLRSVAARLEESNI